MKKILFASLVLLTVTSCGKKKKNIPDVSGIKVDIPIERFDVRFFEIDTNRLEQGLQNLQSQFPDFYPDFMREILGVKEDPKDPNTQLVTREFIRGYASIFDSVKVTFSNLVGLRKELQKGFQFVKYYFPNYKPGKATIFLGPFDAPGVATTNNGLAIGIQQYAGKDFSVYQAGPLQEMFPTYITRRFSKEYIPANCMKSVVAELFPDQSGGKPLIQQMVEKGKQWYLLDLFMPTTADSLKTGYTQQQLDWCAENEGLIWSYIVKNEDLQSLTPSVIQTYIGESPFTQGFSPEFSPGNLGQWIGWQMVKKFSEKNSNMKVEDVMRTPATKIIEEAKYKPK